MVVLHVQYLETVQSKEGVRGHSPDLVSGQVDFLQVGTAFEAVHVQRFQQVVAHTEYLEWLDGMTGDWLDGWIKCWFKKFSEIYDYKLIKILNTEREIINLMYINLKFIKYLLVNYEIIMA